MKILKNRFVKKISIYFVGTLSSNLINVLLLPLYAYFVSADNLGEYDYILSIANMVVPIGFLCIWESALKYCIKEKDNRLQLISNLLTVQFSLSIFIIIVFIILFFFKIERKILIMAVVFVLIQGWTQFWQYLARAYDENRLFIIAGVMGSIAVIIVDAIFIFWGDLNYIGLSVSHVVSQALIWLILEYNLRLFSKMKMEQVSISNIKRLLAFSIPLVVNNVALWFYSGGIRILLRNYIGATEIGLYSFAAKFSVLITLCGSVVSMAFTEEVYSFRTIKEYKVKTAKMISIISKAYFSLILVAVPAIYLLYTIAFRHTEYYLSSDYVFILLLSAVFTALSNNYGSAFQITNPKFLAITTILGAIVAFMISYLFVDKLGIYAILLASVIGPFTMMLLRAIYAKHVTDMSIKWKINIRIIIISVLEVAVLSVCKDYKLQIITLLVSIVIVVIIYKEEIMRLKKAEKNYE